MVNAATAFTDDSTGETVILRFNQVLWYGNRMKMSLINPNQLRHYGITVADDPTDKTRAFGISTEGGVHIPFRMDGTTVYFETRVPTLHELDNCKIVQVISGDRKHLILSYTVSCATGAPVWLLCYAVTTFTKRVHRQDGKSYTQFPLHRNRQSCYMPS